MLLTYIAALTILASLWPGSAGENRRIVWIQTKFKLWCSHRKVELVSIVWQWHKHSHKMLRTKNYSNEKLNKFHHFYQSYSAKKLHKFVRVAKSCNFLCVFKPITRVMARETFLFVITSSNFPRRLTPEEPSMKLLQHSKSTQLISVYISHQHALFPSLFFFLPSPSLSCRKKK